jgi:hypothetical protein
MWWRVQLQILLRIDYPMIHRYKNVAIKIIPNKLGLYLRGGLHSTEGNNEDVCVCVRVTFLLSIIK